MTTLDDFNFRLNRTTEAPAELFTSPEAKLFAKIETDADDTIITSLIKAARLKLQNYCNRSIIDEVWTLSIDGQPGRIDLPKGYIDSVTSVKTYQDNGDVTTESSTDTYNTIVGDYGYIELRTGGSWTGTDRKSDKMIIIYKAGYSATDASVPVDLINACKIIFAEMYQNRSSGIAIPEAEKELANPYRTRVL